MDSYMLTNEMFSRQILATTGTTVNEYFYSDYQGIFQEISIFIIIIFIFII